MRILHITHDWGGGLPKWSNDFSMAAENQGHDCYLFSCEKDGENYGARYVLYKNNFKNVIEEIETDQPIVETDIRNPSYEKILGRVLEKYRIEKLIVSTVIGHSLEVFKFPLPKVFVVHDYFPYCPAINIYHGRPCQSCDDESLRKCVGINEMTERFKKFPAEFWIKERRAFYEALRAGGAALAYPDESVRENLERLDSNYKNLASFIIPHGIDEEQVNCFGGAPDSRKLRLLIPGRFTLDKGNEFIKGLIPHILDRFEILPYGCLADGILYYSQFKNLNPVKEYKPENMKRDLLEMKPDLALLASKVPETFSYTLSEMNCFAIPVVANRLGSFGNRIKPGEGFFFEQNTDSLISVMNDLDKNRVKLRSASAALVKHKSRTITDMVNDYLKII